MEESVASLSKKPVPKNTATMTKWAVLSFQLRIASRNKNFVHESNQVPLDILSSTDPALHSYLYQAPPMK